MDIKNKKISEGEFHALRNEILTQWPTGKDVNLQEAIDYHKAMPENRIFGQKLLNAKKVIPQLNLFFDHMDKGEISPRRVYEASLLRFPGLVWRLMARMANKNIDKDLKSHGIDAAQPSPYL